MSGLLNIYYYTKCNCNSLMTISSSIEFVIAQKASLCFKYSINLFFYISISAAICVGTTLTVNTSSA